MATDGPSWADTWGNENLMNGEEDKPDKNKKKKKEANSAGAFFGRVKSAATDLTQKGKDGASKAYKLVKSKFQSPNKKTSST